MRTDRRDFLKLAGASAGTLLLPPPLQAQVATTPTPEMLALQAYLRASAVPRYALPPAASVRPVVAWAGALSKSAAATTLPDGVVLPLRSPLVGGPLRSRYVAGIPGNPLISGHPCLVIQRPYTYRGTARSGSSPTILRVKTDAPVLEISGLAVDGGAINLTLMVDGEVASTSMLSSGHVFAGGFNFGTVRIDFGGRRLRDLWIEISLVVAHLRVGRADTVLPADDAAEPQITVIGDSFLQSPSPVFGNGIASELAARLGIRKFGIDAYGGTGYRNSGVGVGSLNDRLPGHAGDNSTVYLIMAGLNDYGDLTPTALDWGTRAAYEASVGGYLQALRAAQPGALIVVTAPFCPIPPMSDASYVARPAVNNSGLGDFLYKAQVHKTAVQAIAGPWIYIDVLMGGGWLNSSGASGDVTNLQWFTGGTPAPGTSSTFKPGNTSGGTGGGYGGIVGVPVLGGGQYRQAPELTACGGTGSGLKLASRIDRFGAITSVIVGCHGQGYRPGPGLPGIAIDRTHEVFPATLGTPVLVTGVNPNGMYPLTAFAPPGVRPEDLNNAYALLNPDTVHPSPLGVQYLAARLARNIYEGVMAL